MLKLPNLKYLGYRLLLIVIMAVSIPGFSGSKTIKVGVVDHVPFAMAVAGKPKGLAIDIWEVVAKQKNWKYEFTPVRKSLHEAFGDLNQGKIDVLIGAIPVDQRGLAIAEFSRPYFINKIGIVVKDSRKGFLDYMSTIFGFVSINAVLIVLLAFAVFSHIIWFLEKGYTVPESYFRGVLVSFWFALASFLIREKKPESFSRDKRPQEPLHYITRVIVFFWLIASTTILATLIASITSSLTMALSDTSKKYQVTDFRDKKVAMVEDTDFIIKRSFRMNPVIVPTFDDGLTLLNDNKVDAVIEDTPTARYKLRHESNKNFMITNVILGYNEYAFAFRKGSDLRRQFDITFDQLKSKDKVNEFCTHYLFMDGAMFCEL